MTKRFIKRQDEEGKKDARLYQWVVAEKGHYKLVNSVLATYLRKYKVKDIPRFVGHLRGLLEHLCKDGYLDPWFSAPGGKKMTWRMASLPQILSSFARIQTAIGKKVAQEVEQSGECIELVDKNLVFACNNVKVVWQEIFDYLEISVAESLVAQGIPHTELLTSNYEPLTTNYKLLTSNYELCTANNELLTANSQQATVNNQQEVAVTEQELVVSMGLVSETGSSRITSEMLRNRLL